MRQILMYSTNSSQIGGVDVLFRLGRQKEYAITVQNLLRNFSSDELEQI